MTRVAVFLAICALAACADRTEAPIVPQALDIGAAQTVFIGTSRIKTGSEYGIGRSPQMSYLNSVISLPPNREPGTISDGRATPDPQKDFVLTSLTQFPSAQSFGAAIGQDAARRSSSDVITVYVHGFNNSFADAAFRMAQLSHDLKIDAPVVSYAWPSRGNPLGYEYDADSALFARDGLAEMLLTINQHTTHKVILVAHSMGARLTMETLRQLELSRPGWSARALDGVLLISPDVNIDVFRSQAARFQTWPEPFVIFASRQDRFLRISAALRGEKRRLGNVEDFEELSDLPITVVDVTEFEDADAGNHFVAGSSASLLRLINAARKLDDGFLEGAQGTSVSILGSSRRIGRLTQVIPEELPF